MVDRTLTAKLSAALTDGANLLQQKADGLYAASPAAAGLTVQPASPLAVLTIPNARGSSNGFWSLPQTGAGNTANSSPSTIVTSQCVVTPFMVEQQKTLSTINFRMTAINGGTGTTPCQLYFALQRIDLDSLVTTLVKDFGSYSATSSGVIGSVPNTSGTVLSPGIVYALVFNPGYTTSGGQITTYSPPGMNYNTPLPLYVQNDPPVVADWVNRYYAAHCYGFPAATAVTSSLDLKAAPSQLQSPLYYVTLV